MGISVPVLGTSNCLLSLDISGVPGTGKTATVHAVVRELKRMAENGVRPRSFISGCWL